MKLKLLTLCSFLFCVQFIFGQFSEEKEFQQIGTILEKLSQKEVKAYISAHLALDSALYYLSQNGKMPDSVYQRSMNNFAYFYKNNVKKKCLNRFIVYSYMDVLHDWEDIELLKDYKRTPIQKKEEYKGILEKNCSFSQYELLIKDNLSQKNHQVVVEIQSLLQPQRIIDFSILKIYPNYNKNEQQAYEDSIKNWISGLYTGGVSMIREEMKEASTENFTTEKPKMADTIIIGEYIQEKAPQNNATYIKTNEGHSWADHNNALMLHFEGVTYPFGYTSFEDNNSHFQYAGKYARLGNTGYLDSPFLESGYCDKGHILFIKNKNFLKGYLIDKEEELTTFIPIKLIKK